MLVSQPSFGNYRVSISSSVPHTHRPYAILNIKRIVDGSPDTMPPFESRSMERKYSEAICELTASTRPAGKLICFSEH